MFLIGWIPLIRLSIDGYITTETVSWPEIICVPSSRAAWAISVPLTRSMSRLFITLAYDNQGTIIAAVLLYKTYVQLEVLESAYCIRHSVGGTARLYDIRNLTTN
jgi:hypothetical protein